MERIVVGVDGSSSSIAALRWAVGEAALRGARLEAVSAFHVPYDGGFAVSPVLLDPQLFREGAAAVLAKAVAEVDASALEHGIDQLVVEGSPTTVLIEAGRGSAMIVVGSRGHGGLTGMLLGSTSRQVSEHATVPVVVVPSAGVAS